MCIAGTARWPNGPVRSCIDRDGCSRAGSACRLNGRGAADSNQYKAGYASMRLTILGCGDAFGAGGQLQSCFHIEAAEARFLVDCGATALLAARKAGLDPNSVDTIVLTHLHGDHFAGLVWWVLGAQFASHRRRPLMVVGPAGTQERYRAVAELLYPGSTDLALPFALSFQTFVAGEVLATPHISLRPFTADHPSGGLSAALRIEVDGKVLAFSGDTAWVDELLDCSKNADLFVCECSGYRSAIPHHLSWGELETKLPQISARKIVLTHAGEDMLRHRDVITDARVIVARDQMTLDI